MFTLLVTRIVSGYCCRKLFFEVIKSAEEEVQMLLPHVKETEQFMQLFGREYLILDVSLQRSQVGAVRQSADTAVLVLVSRLVSRGIPPCRTLGTPGVPWLLSPPRTSARRFVPF